jgi:hypothetical protein
MSTTDNGTIVNKVAKSKLVTVDLQQFTPDEDIAELDIKDFLHMELMLKEKEYRQHLENHDWDQYVGKILAVYCSTDAILAPWSFMLVADHAMEKTSDVLVGTKEEAYLRLTEHRILNHDWTQYAGKRVLLKGCSDKSIPHAAYTQALMQLKKHVDRVMYGEACSFVPVYKR